MNKRKKTLLNNGGSQQFNGREGETATFFSRCLLTRILRVFGFAPRHLKRYVPVRSISTS